jgi:hypothetical protein
VPLDAKQREEFIEWAWPQIHECFICRRPDPPGLVVWEQQPSPIFYGLCDACRPANANEEEALFDHIEGLR